jgi:hypothetical protein
MAGTRGFSLPQKYQEELWGQPSFLFCEYRRIFLRLSRRAVSPSAQQLGHEANHSPSCCAKVKNERGYTFALKHAFMVFTKKNSLFTTSIN